MNCFHTALASGALAFTCISATAQMPTMQISKDNRTIAVTATDLVVADADMATVHIGFQIFALDADTAYRQGSAISNAVIDALKKAGVPEKSIESENQSLQHNQEYMQNELPAERAKRQYTLQQSWIIRSSPNDAAKVLHLAVQAGANNSGAIDWDVTDRKALQSNAAAKALERAHAIASQMAAGLGVSLRNLIYASNQAETAAIRPQSMPMMAASVRQDLKPLAVNPRRIEESATVYAVFAIE